ncbi:hypothetical protein, partial [Enterobacter asburiae]|uniref:hypothetical protein n=1 Tax=Enterobacter asburiae TaxID=61645 RepID=UPI001981D5BA
GLTALSAEFTIGEGELMAHDVPLGCAPDEYDDLISGTCSHLPWRFNDQRIDAYIVNNLGTGPGNEFTL